MKPRSINYFRKRRAAKYFSSRFGKLAEFVAEFIDALYLAHQAITELSKKREKYTSADAFMAVSKSGQVMQKLNPSPDMIRKFSQEEVTVSSIIKEQMLAWEKISQLAIVGSSPNQSQGAAKTSPSDLTLSEPPGTSGSAPAQG